MGNFASTAAPRRTLRQRFWRALGFGRYHLTELGDDALSAPGWAITRTVFEFSRRDRLRLLVTGRLLVETRHAFPVRVDEMQSAASFMIAAPGEKV